MTCDRACLTKRQRRVLEAVERLAGDRERFAVKTAEIAEEADLRLNRTREAIGHLVALEFIVWNGRRGRGCYSEIHLRSRRP